MGKLSKTIKRSAKRVNLAQFLGLDPENNPNDRAYIKFNELIGSIEMFMHVKKISYAELGRRLSVTRQAIHEKFTGKKLTLDWIEKACKALNLQLEIRIKEIKKAA